MAAQRAGITAHGVLWVAANAVTDQRITRAAASGFVDAMLGSGARYASEAGGFGAGAEAQNPL